jgi:hypothetical protein
MRALLTHPEEDFELRDLPDDADALTQDLGLDVLIDVMAAGDELVADVARHALLLSLDNPAAIRYRQRTLADCLREAPVVRELYDLTGETLQRDRRIWRSAFNYPSGVLSRAIEAMELYVEMLGRLRDIATDRSSGFESDAFRRLFSALVAELGDDYLGEIREHLDTLRLRKGVLTSVRLGRGNTGVGYMLRTPIHHGWMERLSGNAPESHTIRVPDRDQAGARALGELRDRGVNLAANALAQAAEHILSFFTLLRRELAFYIGCLNLATRLDDASHPRCMPIPTPASEGDRLAARDLYDCALALRTDEPIIGNDVDADGASLVLITGANQGGKSTFLRSLGVAQLMMQAGMFVAAHTYRADARTRLFTHFKREEDEDMERGKFDEELARMSAIADHLDPGAIVLFNESFAATDEQEGSEIAHEIVRALQEAGVKVVFVTHMYKLASRLHAEDDDAVFLRAQRNEDGRRTYKVRPGEPLPTSFGVDLYERIFGAPSAATSS